MDVTWDYEMKRFTLNQEEENETQFLNANSNGWEF